MLVLMRHGQTESNKQGKMTSLSDVPLSEEGQTQVLQSLERNRHLKLDLVVSSPLLRARQTAKPFLNLIQRKVPKMDLKIDPLLTEFDFGIFEGIAGHELLQSEHRELYLAWTNGENVDNGGECWGDLYNRCQLILDKYAPKYPNQDTTLLVTHGYVIRTMLCLLLKSNPCMTQSMRMDNCSMMVVDFERGNLRLTGFNVRTPSLQRPNF